jgi:1-acyl-sn-glycerol-3-phosphate acyltransferase
MYIPHLGDQVPKTGNRLTRGLACAIFRLLGWRFEGRIPNLAKFVAIVAPHTSAWDFGIGMVVLQALGLRVSWLGADWIFRFPFARALGGIPVNRSKSQGLVAQSIQHFRNRTHLVIVLSPEGSRKKVRWKRGFYRIATRAEVPILPIVLDLRKKLVLFEEVCHLSGDLDTDMAQLRPFYEEFLEKYPENFEFRW